jgi:hypothetical protein
MLNEPEARSPKSHWIVSLPVLYNQNCASSVLQIGYAEPRSDSALSYYLGLINAGKRSLRRPGSNHAGFEDILENSR